MYLVFIRSHQHVYGDFCSPYLRRCAPTVVAIYDIEEVVEIGGFIFVDKHCILECQYLSTMHVVFATYVTLTLIVVRFSEISFLLCILHLRHPI